MCGIIGYVGRDSAMPVLIDGLRRLEYRGYDSAGLAMLINGESVVRKRAGRIDDLADLVADLDGRARIGIGHTRWATHGPPTDSNAHPHCSCDREISVVHNGIIENYEELRQWLKELGHEFSSDTDTEVIPHLVEHFSGQGADLHEAVLLTAERLNGAYALVIMSHREPDRLIAVRKASPLVIGLGDDENLVASDIPALLKRTRDVIILEDGDVAVITTGQVTVTGGDRKPVSREVRRVDWTADQAERGGYPHFMLKEIHEQPDAIAATIQGRIDPAGGISLPELDDLPVPTGIHVVACGTAYHAGLVGKQAIERLARIPVQVHLASEFRYQDPIVHPDQLVIAVSQSGETADTLASVREAGERGARVLAVTNVVDSTVSREADAVLYTRAGPEVAVAATKTYTCQVVALLMVAVHYGLQSGNLDSAAAAGLGRDLLGLPGLVRGMLDTAVTDELVRLSEEIAEVEDCFFLGRGVDYAAVQEGQLKMKEISYVHAEALAAGELKHGTLALITDGVFVITCATQPVLYDKVANNLAQVRARGGRILLITRQGNTRLGPVDTTIELPGDSDFVAPVLAAVPLQLLAYYTGVGRGCDVDKPRNLAKSVTVE